MMYQWQYNGVSTWDEVTAWCRTHIPNQWCTNNYETLWFNTEQAYAWFLLRWA